MRMMITGATGYMGTKTVEVALEQGHEVLAMTRSEDKAVSLQEKGATAIVGDLLQDGDWQKQMAEVEYVIHLAAPPTWGKKVTKKVARKYQQGHYEMTKRLMDSVDHGNLKKLVYIAGTSYYGDPGEGEPVDESFSSEPKGWGPYIAPSVDALPGYVKKGLPIVSAFPGQVYGADSWFPQLFLEPLYHNKAVVGLKGSDVIFSMIHVEDAARAFLFLCEKGEPGERYNLVDDEPLRSGEVLTFTKKALGVVQGKSRSVPKWLCNLMLGPVLTEYATSNTNFSNKKLRALGFEYLYPTCGPGLANVVDEWKQRQEA